MQKNNQKTNLDIRTALKSKILVIDGAMGTCLQGLDLGPQDFGGEEYEGCNEYLNLTRPEVIQSIHFNYLKSGANIIETNTFGATPLVLDEYRLGHLAFEINKKAVELAQNAREDFKNQHPDLNGDDHPIFIAGAMGPTTKAISVTGGVTFEELISNYFVQASGLMAGGCDYFLLETCQDTRNIKAGYLAIQKLFKEKKCQIPIAVSGTIEPMGSMLAGQTVESLWTSLEHMDLLYIGLNCATGPDFMTDYMRVLSQMANSAVACVPNAGLPDEDGHYLENPQMMKRSLERFCKEGWINLLGGCCGTTYQHIQEFAALAKMYQPRTWSEQQTSWLSGIDFLEITQENRPILVGERTNVIGSKKFKDLINEEKYEEAAEVAKAQVKNGALIVDVCLANPDRDEAQDMEKFLAKLIKTIKVPLMIDSTDEKVIELALKYSQGKAIINSINLEDGEERFEKVVPLAKSYGAALVVGTIDDDPEQGMGVSKERKLSIAKKSFDLLTKKYGVKPQDIYFDPLVFPCATGDENYRGSARETIEGIRLIKESFPLCKIALGISNVSFGLPISGREVLNSVFTYHCTKAGLDLALVNTQHFKRFNQISEEEVKLAEDLLFDKTPHCIKDFNDFYKDKKTVQKREENLPLLERLPRYILEGSKDGLLKDLQECLTTMAPMQIINGPLMKGMDVVGKLFNENKLIVAEVLQSAEVMKSAVAFLEPFMEVGQVLNKGKVILATVKGDVHDIGKNLVDIVLTNNGFEVINLGIKINSDQLIHAVKEHSPDMIGLSGLLVKSAQQMVLTASDLAQMEISTPILVGGAALTRKFVNNKISPEYGGTVVYAKDAMNGLELANTIVDPDGFARLKQELKEERSLGQSEVVSEVKVRIERKDRSSQVPILSVLPKPADYKRHVLKNTPIDVIWNYINPLMLYGRHLGVKGKIIRELGLLDKEDFELAKKDFFSGKKIDDQQDKMAEILKTVSEVKKEYKKDYFTTGAVYQFFPAYSENNSLHLLAENGKEILETFHFPRQDKEDGLCLSDYVHPQLDSVGMFVVTVGQGIMDLSQRLKEKGDYLKCHIVQALALESAEAYAEYLHQKMRNLWGYQDQLNMKKMDLFQAKYHGKRYSFGYPACPSLEDQHQLFRVLSPEGDIGCQLTEGCMMEPEASVSALVFHHPNANYFSVGDKDFMAQIQ
jgi:5-methyltetrahydrofolate--homocysteine methyltransferase